MKTEHSVPKSRPIAALLLLSALLPACGTKALSPQLKLTVKPHEVAQNTPGAQVDHYLLGRHYQTSGRIALAMAAYSQAIRLQHREVEVRSALAELYSNEGRLSEAERLLREVIAQAPPSAYLHNNLGYVYFLQGNIVAAIRELRTALAVDSRHEWARNNLRLAEAALTRRMTTNVEPATRRADTTVKAFEAWGEVSKGNGHEVNAESAVATTPRAPATAVKLATPDAAPAAGVVAQLPDERNARQSVGVFDRATPLQPRPAAGLAQLDRGLGAPVANPVVKSPKKYRLEVSNGNGITNLARRVSQHLMRDGITVHNLTNQLPYQQATTEIQYAAGFEREAEQIRQSLRGHVIVTRTSATLIRTELRVVLGKDFSARMVEIEAEKPSKVATSQIGTGRL